MGDSHTVDTRTTRRRLEAVLNECTSSRRKQFSLVLSPSNKGSRFSNGESARISTSRIGDGEGRMTRDNLLFWCLHIRRANYASLYLRITLIRAIMPYTSKDCGKFGQYSWWPYPTERTPENSTRLRF